GDTLLVHAEDLADPEHPRKLGYRLADADQLAVCSRIVNGRRKQTDDPDYLYGCAQRQVLAVVSVSTFQKPTSAGQSTEGKARPTWVDPGRIAGDVLLFRLDNGKFLGSYTFSAKNEKVDSYATFAQLEAELLENYSRALDAASRARAPSLTPRFDLAK